MQPLRPRGRALLATLTALLLARPPPVTAAARPVQSASHLEAAGRLAGLGPAAGALGWEGPLGPWGPLGELGPLGDHPWNPGRFLASLGDFSPMAARLSALGGPLSGEGPLGPSGPVGDVAYGSLLRSPRPATRALAAGGALVVLGPAGPLGALGPLGPLGPVGAHGFSPDPGGTYRDPGGAPVATVELVEPFSSRGQGHPFELVELVTEDAPQPLDTSFVLQGRVTPEAPDTVRVRSRSRQPVTILVLPLRSYRPFLGGAPTTPWGAAARLLRDVDLEVRGAGGRLLATSDSLELVDWVHLEARAGEVLEVTVRAKPRAQGLERPYRLVVVGATDRLPR